MGILVVGWVLNNVLMLVNVLSYLGGVVFN